MKTYSVEFKRTSFVTITIEAESSDHAEELAWKELVESYDISGEADWQTESITQELK